MIDDRPIDDLDPGVEPIGEAEGAGLVQLLEAPERGWRGIVVVPDSEVERQASRARGSLPRGSTTRT